nr:putative GH32 family protein [Didymodactylos carnosus]WEI57606.1 putative GH32 family protein [Didymodactylos carnosus]
MIILAGLLSVLCASYVLTDDQFRPQFHLMPEKNWLNDPNGPMYFNGYYHMFYQYNPNAPVPDTMYWGHCFSTDMVHWIRLPVALAPDHSYDQGGCWTGSATIVNGVPTIIYTGINSNGQQVQNQAFPADLTDPTLTIWTKSSLNPLITSPNGRDPSTGFQLHDGYYYLIYGFGTEDLGGQAVLFRSQNFKNWTYMHPFHSNHYDSFWECPDIFNISSSNQLVLKASLLGHDFWATGSFDFETQTFVPTGTGDVGEFSQLIDQGRFYASKTFYDPIDDQQVIFGWVAEEDNHGADRGWQGCHSLPRRIELSDDGQEIRSHPIDNLKSLRDKSSHKKFINIPLSSSTPFRLIDGLIGNQIELLINWQFPMYQVIFLLFDNQTS